MLIPKLGLKARFVAACLLLVSISTAGYYYAVSQLVEFVEIELQDKRLLGELKAFAHAFERDPQTQGPRAVGLSSYLLPAAADVLSLPEPLRRLNPGVHEDLHLDGREVTVARQDVNGARLYVVLDMEGVEEIEARFVNLAWICALISWFAAVALALWLAHRVLRPVERLAELVGNVQPGDYQQRLAPKIKDEDVRVIAAAFDRFMQRIEAFVAREQAFTEDASHELRTPLSIIDSSAQILVEDAQLSAAARQRVQRILRAVEQMKTLIETLLFLAREEGGQLSEALPLHQIVAELVDNYSELLAAKHIDLSVSAVATVVRAPRGMALCVINNLLINAIHYTERGRIDIQVAPGHLSIQDSGIGIRPEDMERIFERRFRGTESRGLGLGLYLVKRICDRLGWHTRVSSSGHDGTRFEVFFS